MHLKNFGKAGHPPTLLGAFLYFDVSFMIWVLVGALGIFIAKDFGLSPTAKGLVVAIPILGGSLLRLPMGIMADHIGSKRTALFGMGLTAIPLLMAWMAGKTLPQIYLTGLFLGIAGASFAVALPMASRWYPPEHQGLAMGIAGAGNSGTVLAAFFAPRLAESYGWHAVFGFALIPLLAVMVYFTLFAKDSPTHPPAIPFRRYFLPLKEADAVLFCFFYMITFGGFVGLASFLPIFFNDQYSVSRIMAGNLTALCVFAGSFCRPLGGYISDRIGGIRYLSFLYAVVAACLLLVATLPPLPLVVLLLFITMLLLGMGNGAIFQLVPQRFPREIGTITGLVGTFGGFGGFLLPLALGGLKDRWASYGIGFLLFAFASLTALAILRAVQVGWRKEWNQAEGAVL
jgi:NNP family nitrate/nitrite transporter-like MFS transporter